MLVEFCIATTRATTIENLENYNSTLCVGARGALHAALTEGPIPLWNTASRCPGKVKNWGGTSKLQLLPQQGAPRLSEKKSEAPKDTATEGLGDHSVLSRNEATQEMRIQTCEFDPWVSTKADTGWLLHLNSATLGGTERPRLATPKSLREVDEGCV